MADVLVDVLGALALLFVTFVSYRARATDLWGSVSGYLIGLAIALSAGWAWLYVLLSFLISGSLVTKYRYVYKESIHAAEEKGGARGVKNVMANGGVATALALAYGLWRASFLPYMFVSALASSTADTFATEIGLLSRSAPVLIHRPSRKVQPGVSGGVTTLGEVAAMLGSLCISIVSSLVGLTTLSPHSLAITSLAGFVGCNVDSLIGGVAQALRRCPVCGSLTEKRTHCGASAQKVKGFGFLGNNLVNLISSASAALAAALLLSVA